MKKLIYIIYFLSLGLFAQQTTDFFGASSRIWIEDFSSFTNETGIVVNAGIVTEQGDFNSSFTKWTLDASAVTTNANATIINEINGIYMPSLNVSNTNGELVWESEVIDVSSFTENHIALTVSNEGMAENDYIDVYWKVVGIGNYILIDDDSIGHTFVGENSETCWKFDKTYKDLTVTNPGNIQIKVVFNSSSDTSILKLNKLEVFGKN